MDDGAIEDGLAGILPGPDLCAALASLELGSVSDVDLLAVLSAQYRQLSHQQAAVWAVMAEIARRDPTAGIADAERWTAQQIFESAVDEIRAELRLTRRGAEAELTLATQVAELPLVTEAVSRGELDRRRAQVLVDTCRELTPGQQAKLLSAVLPEAASLSWTGLRDRARRAAIALDPAWAQRRYRQAVRERKVVAYLADDGSATITAQGLPVEDAAAASARVDSVARAAKRAGATATLDHLRADVFTGLLDGSFHDLDRDGIVAALLAAYPPDSRTETTSDAAENSKSSGDENCTSNSNAPEPTHINGNSGSGASQIPPTAPARSTVLAGVHVRVRLSTLLGLDELPGEITGLGPVPADVARTIVSRQHHGCEWRYGVVDEVGRLLSDGTTRRRPVGDVATLTARGGIVELHVSEELLTEGTLPTAPAWVHVLADIASQYATGRRATQDPTARFAAKPLRRHIQIITPYCIGPACRRPSSNADLDHRQRFAQGGRTVEPNLSPLCRHEHRNKDERGWQLHRRDEFTYEWTSPLGRCHRVEVPPVAPPLPAALPRELPPELLDDNECPADSTCTPTDRSDGPITTAQEAEPDDAEEPRPPPDDPPY